MATVFCQTRFNQLLPKRVAWLPVFISRRIIMIHENNDLFEVFCLCAQWCGTCRDYRAGFDALAGQFSNTVFTWIDIEEQADLMGDTDIENFPTLLIKRKNLVLYFGVMLPHLSHLQRILKAFMEMSWEQSTSYVRTNAERRLWQDDPVLSALNHHVLSPSIHQPTP